MTQPTTGTINSNARLCREPNFSYRAKRLIIPIFSMPVIAFGFVYFDIRIVSLMPTTYLIGYAVVGMLVDWFYFTYKNYKDSDYICEQFLQSIGVTGQQIDQLNHFLVKTRKIAVCASVSVTAASVLFQSGWDWELTAIFSYAAATWLTVIGGSLAKKVVWPYWFAPNTSQQAHQFYNSTSSPRDNCDQFDIRNATFYKNNSSPAFEASFHTSTAVYTDNCNPFDATSSAAYLPGGVCDPSRFD